jgi:hypothetical protein
MIDGYCDESHFFPASTARTFVSLNVRIMRTNMGSADRMVRLLAAVLLTVLYLTKVITGTPGLIILVVAGVFLLTSLVRFCPLYTLLGVNTCGTKKV